MSNDVSFRASKHNLEICIDFLLGASTLILRSRDDITPRQKTSKEKKNPVSRILGEFDIVQGCQLTLSLQPSGEANHGTWGSILSPLAPRLWCLPSPALRPCSRWVPVYRSWLGSATGTRLHEGAPSSMPLCRAVQCAQTPSHPYGMRTVLLLTWTKECGIAHGSLSPSRG